MPSFTRGLLIKYHCLNWFACDCTLYSSNDCRYVFVVPVELLDVRLRYASSPIVDLRLKNPSKIVSELE